MGIFRSREHGCHISEVKYWEIIADKLSASGWTWGYCTLATANGSHFLGLPAPDSTNRKGTATYALSAAVGAFFVDGTIQPARSLNAAVGLANVVALRLQPLFAANEALEELVN